MRNAKQKSPERGAAIVEFAIVLPFLLLLLVGIVEFGLLFYNQQVLTNSSREGARSGIARFDVNSDSVINVSDINSVVESYCDKRLITFGTELPPNTVVDVEGVPYPGPYPDKLTVTVDYDYTFFAPALFGFGTSIQLNAETIMRMETEEE